jgi:hypothetical protein
MNVTSVYLKIWIKEKKFNIPGVIGCVDGTHVRITAPNVDEPSFVNRKGFHSLNVQATCDHEGMNVF